MLASDGATTHRFDSPGSGIATVVYVSAVQSNTIRWDRVANIALATWFVSLSLMRLTVLWSDRGADIRLYLAGTREWLAGGDPWSVHFGTFHFAAAPPSLLPMVPFALMPEPLAIALLTVLAIVASFWMLRKLGCRGGGSPSRHSSTTSGTATRSSSWCRCCSARWRGLRRSSRPMPSSRSSSNFAFERWPSRPGRPDHAADPAVGRFLGHLSHDEIPVRAVSGRHERLVLPGAGPVRRGRLGGDGRQRASWWFVPALWPSTQWYYS